MSSPEVRARESRTIRTGDRVSPYWSRENWDESNKPTENGGGGKGSIGYYSISSSAIGRYGVVRESVAHASSQLCRPCVKERLCILLYLEVIIQIPFERD